MAQKFDFVFLIKFGLRRPLLQQILYFRNDSRLGKDLQRWFSAGERCPKIDQSQDEIAKSPQASNSGINLFLKTNFSKLACTVSNKVLTITLNQLRGITHEVDSTTQCSWFCINESMFYHKTLNQLHWNIDSTFYIYLSPFAMKFNQLHDVVDFAKSNQRFTTKLHWNVESTFYIYLSTFQPSPRAKSSSQCSYFNV